MFVLVISVGIESNVFTSVSIESDVFFSSVGIDSDVFNFFTSVSKTAMFLPVSV